MKNVLLIGVCIGLLVLNACNEKDPEVNPLVSIWKLDEISGVVVESGFESNDFSGDATINFSLELRSDLTYTRIYGEGPSAIEENGNWEQDGDFVELDPEAGTAKDETTFLFYRFDITSITDRELDIEFEDNFSTFPDAKITEWVGDGTLVENTETGFLEWTIDVSEREVLFNEFYTEVTQKYNLNFDKAN